MYQGVPERSLANTTVSASDNIIHSCGENVNTKIRDTANRINGFERPKPNEGYALENGVSNNSISENSKKSNPSDEIFSKSAKTPQNEGADVTAMLKRADEVVTENYRKIEKALKGATEAKRASMIQEFSLDKAFNPDGTLKPDFLTRGNEAKADSEGEFKYSYAGKKAATADKLKLSTAESMLANGVDSETVRKETGWHKGYDGKWRFEIDDSEFDIALNGKYSRNPDIHRYNELVEKVYFLDNASAQEAAELAELDKKIGDKNITPNKLGDLIKHPTLFEAYPELADVDVYFHEGDANTASYHPGFKEISLPRKMRMDSKKLKSTLIHEIQHAIQDIEGFAGGSNTDMFVNSSERSAYQQYRDTAGEIEARDSAARLNYSQEQRKNTRPDIDKEDVVFAYDSNISYALAENAEAEVEAAINNKIRKDYVKLTENTPSILLAQKGVKNLPLFMKPSHVRENILTEGEALAKGYKVDEHTNYHGLGKEKFLEVIGDLDNVTEAYRGTKNADNPQRGEKYFLLISKLTDADGNIINVPIYINEKTRYHDVIVDTNKVATVFGKNELQEYVKREIRKGNIVRIKKRNFQVSDAATPIVAGYDKKVSNNSIPNPEEKVNPSDEIFSKSAKTPQNSQEATEASTEEQTVTEEPKMQNSASKRLESEFYSVKLRGRENEIRADLKKLSEDTGEEIRPFRGEFTEQGKKNFISTKKMITSLNNEGGAGMHFVIVEANDSFNGVQKGDIIYIAADAIERGISEGELASFAGTVAHEFGHALEGSSEFDELTERLMQDDMLLAAAMNAVEGGYGITIAEAQRLRNKKKSRSPCKGREN